MQTDAFRKEKDSLGTKNVPEDVYYGVQTLRAAENFHITGLTMHPEIINSLAYIKKAAAITNSMNTSSQTQSKVVPELLLT